MVTKFVNTPSQGDLFNPFEFFGAGNDTLFVMIPTPMETAIRTYQGNDVVIVTVPPAAGSTGYRFFLGTGNDTLQASHVHDEYYDEGGDDQVNMGDGGDEVFAGPGNDTIDGGNDTSGGSGIQGDTINFGFAYDMFGNRTPVTQGVTLDLASTSPQALGFYGNDTYLNFESVIGGVGNDHFSGTNAANFMHGNVGADFLRGFGGNDKLMGGPGQDILIGDGGADHLDVGQSIGLSVGEFDGEADVVKYISISDSTFDGGMDEIFNFQNIAAGGNDKIDLSAIDANPSLAGNQAFQFVGSANFSLPGGEVRITTVGGNTVIMVDNDGDATAEMVILIHDTTGLTAGDFIL